MSDEWEELGETDILDQTARFRALMDQGREAAVELAHSAAAFYRTLIEDGVDRIDATELTREYVVAMLSDPVEE